MYTKFLVILIQLKTIFIFKERNNFLKREITYFSPKTGFRHNNFEKNLELATPNFKKS